MKVAVWDTYATKKDGCNMHLDIVVPEEVTNKAVIHGYGWAYLKPRDRKDNP